MNTPPSIATTAALTASLFTAAPDSFNCTLNPLPYKDTITPLPQWHGKKATKRTGLNQRQRRKDRRRAWAAGNRNAFD
jgi:hypothetical protein